MSGRNDRVRLLLEALARVRRAMTRRPSTSAERWSHSSGRSHDKRVATARAFHKAQSKEYTKVSLKYKDIKVRDVMVATSVCTKKTPLQGESTAVKSLFDQTRAELNQSKGSSHSIKWPQCNFPRLDRLSTTHPCQT
jgi:hypothetical protein